jgi:hypothetical protein
VTRELQPGDWISGPFWDGAVKVVTCEAHPDYDVMAVVELLARDNPERKALESLLGTRVDLEERASRWAETHPHVEAREEDTSMVQGGLWEEEKR